MKYAISATAIRVFCGFKNPTLPDDRFYHTVGRTFMPGTPYMLRQLGLASYTSGVLVGVADPMVPQEFALIGYASADTYRAAMSSTLQGRMYGQTHGGVYDLARSHAAFPVNLDQLPDGATDPYFTWGETTDWQAGRIGVFLGRARKGQEGTGFRQLLRGAIEKTKQQDNDLLICSPDDRYCVVWVHSQCQKSAAPDWAELKNISDPLLETFAQRVVWRDNEPPAQDFTASSALNWIFVREDRYFLK